MNLLTEIDSQTQKANLRLAKWEGQINQEFGINIHTVLYIYKKTNKDLLYSTGNYIKYLVITYSRKELEKECTCAGVLSSFSRVQLFATLWTVAHQVPLSMGFSRQESWSGLPSPPPGYLPHSGIVAVSLMSPAQVVYTYRSFSEHISLNTLQQQEASLLGLRKFEYQLFLSSYIFLSWTVMQYSMN